VAQFEWRVEKPTTGGPYAYVILRNGTALKAATGLTTPNAALNAIRDDIGAAFIGGETVVRMSGNTQTAEP
jgi:hypothetical protein